MTDRLTLISLAVTAGLAMSACGSPDRPSLNEATTNSTTTTSSSTSTQATAPNTNETAGNLDQTTSVPANPVSTIPTLSPSMRAISLVETLQVFDERPEQAPSITLSDQTSFGSARVLLVEAVDSDWIQVRVPMRPNERTGWVRASDVRTESLELVITVDLDQRRLSVIENGTVVREETVAVGSPDNPTPKGVFFVTDKVDTLNDGGAYGPYAIGLSAYSDSLTEFAGGDGQIGIHGTNDPSSIGQDVSHGCVRLPNEVISILAIEVPLGTKVIIL